MNYYDTVLSFILDANPDSRRAANDVLHNIIGKVDDSFLKGVFVHKMKMEMRQKVEDKSTEEVLDKVCEIYGFNWLLDFLRERREYEYEDTSY